MKIRVSSIIALTSVAACMSRDSAPATTTVGAAQEEAEAKADMLREAAPAAPAALAPGGGGRGERARKQAKGGSGLLGSLSTVDKKDSSALFANEVASAEADGAVEGGHGGEAAPPTRAWFPESFVFQPRVVTDDTGRATLDVLVPDRLTTWRLLALAHTRSGEQAGAVTQFLGTLPVYVEPVVPRALIAGDVVRVPIQLANTTEAAVRRQLELAVEGATLEGAARREVVVPAGGSVVETVVLAARQPGEVALTATLVGADAVRRTVGVSPRGRRVEVERSGTLAAPRERLLEAPRGEFSSAVLEVVPGALAVVRNELAAAGQRGAAADVAYALLLAGEAPGLLAKLGGEADGEALRALRVVATQRALRHARVATLETATLLVEGALAHPDQPVLVRLGERLSAQLAGWQRPDGTFGGANGWTLQRLLAGTAEAVLATAAEQRATRGADVDASRALRARTRAESARLSASAAVERNLGRIEDPYTASLLVVSGAAQGSLADQLRAKVRAAVKVGEDGARTLELGKDVVRADGLRPSDVEAAAVAALALAGDAEAPWVADLASTVLAGYVPGFGFGDGHTNLWALRAVLATFTQPLPSSVKITLELDGRVLSEGTFDAQRLRDVLRLDAQVPEASGAHRWGIRAEPAVPGLGYRLALTTWVPFAAEPEAGVALEVRTAGEPKVGRAVDVSLVASAPAGHPLSIVHRLPAGVVPDRPSLDALVSSGALSAYDTEDGAVRLSVPALAPAAPWRATYRVVPTLAGTLHSGATTIEVAGETRTLPPAPWTIRP